MVRSGWHQKQNLQNKHIDTHRTMKRLFGKTKKLIRGTSTAVLISAALHITLLVAASGWVIFTVVQNQAAKFVPVKVDRPKMDLKKLRVKVKDSSKPRKSSERIVSSRRSAMSDLQLPKMTGTGMGEGLAKGISGFDLMADLSKMTILGGGRSVGNDLEGTFYHLLKDRSGNPLPDYYPVDGEPNQNYTRVLNTFLANNWSRKTLDQFWRSPTKLYATFFMLPPFVSNFGPKKFGLSEDEIGASYLVHYKGKIAHKTGGKFRFWGTADDLLFIRINGKLVLDGRDRGGHTKDWKTPENWKSSDPENAKYFLGQSMAIVGDWFALEPGVPVEMEVLFGEDQGGRTSCMLNIQQFGVEYPTNQYKAPILPAFKTAPIPEHLVDEIEYGLIEGESDLTGGPVFGVY
jgi:hypothetical protein